MTPADQRAEKYSGKPCRACGCTARRVADDKCDECHRRRQRERSRKRREKRGQE
jgi:hypothetical protein